MAHLVQVDAQRLEHARGDAFALAHEAEQKVLRADVVVAEPTRLVDRQLDHALGARRQAHLADDRPIAPADDELDRGPHLGELDVHVLEHARGDTLALAHEAEQQVLRADVVVVEPLRLVLSQRQDLARAIRELVEAIHAAELVLPWSRSDLRAMLAPYPGSGAGPKGGCRGPRRMADPAGRASGGPIAVTTGTGSGTRNRNDPPGRRVVCSGMRRLPGGSGRLDLHLGCRLGLGLGLGLGVEVGSRLRDGFGLRLGDGFRGLGGLGDGGRRLRSRPRGPWVPPRLPQAPARALTGPRRPRRRPRAPAQAPARRRLPGPRLLPRRREPRQREPRLLPRPRARMPRRSLRPRVPQSLPPRRARALMRLRRPPAGPGPARTLQPAWCRCRPRAPRACPTARSSGPGDRGGRGVRAARRHRRPESRTRASSVPAAPPPA